MLAPPLEQAISRLEGATEQLLTAEFSDLAALCQALEHRANAITQLALIAGDGSADKIPGTAVERLAAVLVHGEQAVRRILQARRETGTEWLRLNRVLQNMGREEPATQMNVEL